MGAKYAPSLANLFIAKWEQDVIDTQNRPEVVLWARYIDYVLLWDDSKSGLLSFMALNVNGASNLILKPVWRKLNFLDLMIRVKDEIHQVHL